MEKNEIPSGKSEKLEVKDFELFLWSLHGIIFLIYLLYNHPLDFLLSHPGVYLDLFFAFSPLTFSLLFSMIYNNYPISHVISLLKKENVEK